MIELFTDLKPENGKDFGLTISISAVARTNGDIELGCSYKDSEGRDFSAEAAGDDLDCVSNEVFESLLEDILSYKETAEEVEETDDLCDDMDKRIEELEASIRSLELDNQILESRLAMLSNNSFNREGDGFDYDAFHRANQAARERLKKYLNLSI